MPPAAQCWKALRNSRAIPRSQHLTLTWDGRRVWPRDRHGAGLIFWSFATRCERLHDAALGAFERRAETGPRITLANEILRVFSPQQACCGCNRGAFARPRGHFTMHGPSTQFLRRLWARGVSLWWTFGSSLNNVFCRRAKQGW